MSDNKIKLVEKRITSARELKIKLESDPHRPIYHFTPHWAWMNDINGAIFWNGRYHIFYQHNPDGGYWNWIQWGHASSVDLVHWVHHPIALTPTVDGPDRDGCYSGGAFVDKHGMPTLIYHGEPDGTCIATSEDDLLINWSKNSANPVIKVPQFGDDGFGEYIVFDPCAWVVGDDYYAIVGNTIPGMDGDSTSLFKSHDKINWEYIGPFYQSDRQWTMGDEDCAVPDFFHLDRKSVLLFASHLFGTQYYVGEIHGERFTPESHGRLSGPGGQLGGARTLLDASGRRIMFDWVIEIREKQQSRLDGWSGMMSLPRVISISEDGTMRLSPVPELNVLRMNNRVFRDITIKSETVEPVRNVKGDSMEFNITLDLQDAHEAGIRVRCSPDGAEYTSISYNSDSKQLKVDFSKSTTDTNINYY